MYFYFFHVKMEMGFLIVAITHLLLSHAKHCSNHFLLYGVQ